MDKILQGIVIGVFGGLFSGFGIWVLDRVRECWNFKRDEKKIVAFISKTINDTDKPTPPLASREWCI